MAVPGAGGAGAFAQKFAAMRSAKEMFKDCMRWVNHDVSVSDFSRQDMVGSADCMWHPSLGVMQDVRARGWRK
jgi:hypothetical protein